MNKARLPNGLTCRGSLTCFRGRATRQFGLTTRQQLPGIFAVAKTFLRRFSTSWRLTDVIHTRSILKTEFNHLRILFNLTTTFPCRTTSEALVQARELRLGTIDIYDCLTTEMKAQRKNPNVSHEIHNKPLCCPRKAITVLLSLSPKLTKSFRRRHAIRKVFGLAPPKITSKMLKTMKIFYFTQHAVAELTLSMRIL